MTQTFHDLGVDPALADALAARGITTPFPIQERSLPMALAGSDLIGQARTGTGKTLAFGLPLLTRLDPALTRTQALVIVPTRELCLQVADELAIGAARGLTSIAIYGGVPYEEQVEAVRGGVHVVVGTPGRLLDLLQRGDLDLSGVSELVLDEADEMLDMGFLPDVERLIEACGSDRHGMLFSATMPTEVVRMARRYLASPVFVRADHEVVNTAPLVTQHFFQVHRLDKPRILARILQAPERGSVYVFVRTKMKADRLVEELAELGVDAIAIHGDLRQTTRERNMDRFREGRSTVLVATEVAARGLDVDNVTHVVNFDCPEDDRMYLHRIGRTARAGRAGVAVTFCEHNEVARLDVIRRAIGQEDNAIVEVFSTSELLTERFTLPEERPWDRAAGARRSTPRSEGRSEGRGGSRSESRSGARSSGRGEGRREDRTAGRGEGGREDRGGGRRQERDDDERSSASEPEASATRTRRRTRGGASTASGDSGGRTDGAIASSEGEGRTDGREDGGSERAGDGTGERGGGRRRARSGRTADRGSDASEASETADATIGASADGTSEDATGPDGGARRSRRHGGGRGGRRTAGTTSDGTTSDGEASSDRATSDEGRARRSRSGSGRSGSTGGSGSASGSGRSGSGGSGSGGSGSGRSGGSGSGRSGGSGDAEGGRGNGRSGGRTRARSNGEGRGAGTDRTKRSAPVDGEAARGQGQPQVARRVRVDHLP